MLCYLRICRQYIELLYSPVIHVDQEASDNALSTIVCGDICNNTISY